MKNIIICFMSSLLLFAGAAWGENKNLIDIPESEQTDCQKKWAKYDEKIASVGTYLIYIAPPDECPRPECWTNGKLDALCMLTRHGYFRNIYLDRNENYPNEYYKGWHGWTEYIRISRGKYSELTDLKSESGVSILVGETAEQAEELKNWEHAFTKGEWMFFKRKEKIK